MTQRFHAAARTDDRPDRLAVRPGPRADGMTPVSWDAHGNLYLGDPILDFTVTQLLDEEKFETTRAVLDKWISNDLRNVVRQQMGMRASSGPSKYKTNQIPPGTGFGTFSITEIPDEVCEKAELTAAEHLEWLGEVMLRRDDRVGALLAGLMVRHLLPGEQDPRTLGFDPGGLYAGLRSAPWQIADLDPTRRMTFAGLLDAFIDELEDRTK